MRFSYHNPEEPENPMRIEIKTPLRKYILVALLLSGSIAYCTRSLYLKTRIEKEPQRITATVPSILEKTASTNGL